MNLLDFADQEAARQGVDAGLVRRVIHQESRGNVGAVSPKGALGPMQLMPATARGLGVDPNDPLDNIRGGIRYLKQQLDAFGDPRLALAAYNAGPGAVRKHGGIPPFAETQNYVRAIMGEGGSAQSGADIFGMGGGAPAARGGSGADIFAPTAKPAKPALPAIKVTAGDLSRISPPADARKDALRSFTSHAFAALADTAGKFNPADQPIRMLSQAQGVAQTIYDLAHGKPVVPTLAQSTMRAASTASPAAATARPVTVAAGQDYTPQTRAGRWAAALGTMAPAALLPGSAGARVANVVAPAVGSEGAREVTEALGGGQLAQQIAQFVGGAAGGLGAGVRMKMPAAAEKPMDLPALKLAKQQAYDAVDNIGAAYAPEAVGTLKQGIRESMLAEELDPDLHPKVAATVRLVEKRLADGEPLTLSRLDKTRQLVRANIFDGGGTPEEKRLGGMILDNIDEFVAAAGPDQMVAGDGPRAAAAIAKARDMNTRYRKVEGVLDAVGAADIQAAKAGSGGNIDNATRQQVARFLAKSRNLTPDEQAALMRIIKPGVFHDALRGVGRMSPTNGAIMSAAGIGATAMGGGPGAALPLAGLASKLLADGMTKANVGKLLDLMAVGGSTSELPAAQLPQMQMAPSPLNVRGAPVPMGLFGSMALTPAAIR